MNPIIIHFHSLSGLISNSSSEVFTSATTKTVSTVKKILTVYLEALSLVPEAPKADDIFDVGLAYQVEPESERFTKLLKSMGFKQLDGLYFYLSQKDLDKVSEEWVRVAREEGGKEYTDAENDWWSDEHGEEKDPMSYINDDSDYPSTIVLKIFIKDGAQAVLGQRFNKESLKKLVESLMGLNDTYESESHYC